MQKEVSIALLRLKQVKRAIQEIGWGYLILILPILLLGELALLEGISQIEPPWSLAFLYLVLFIVVHHIRQDFLFLQKININLRRLFLVEYNFLALLISLLLLPTFNIIGIITGHIFISLAALLWPTPSLKQVATHQLPHIPWVPIYLFEWRSGIRRFNWWLGITWLIGLGLSWHHYAYLVGVFFFSLFIPSIFNYNEGKELKPHNIKEVHQKVIQNTLFLLLLILPQLILYLAFNGQDYAYILVGVIYYLISIQTFSILYKYANYSQYMPVYNEMPAAIFVLFSLVLPISLLWLAINYFKVRNRI